MWESEWQKGTDDEKLFDVPKHTAEYADVAQHFKNTGMVRFMTTKRSLFWVTVAIVGGSVYHPVPLTNVLGPETETKTKTKTKRVATRNDRQTGAD